MPKDELLTQLSELEQGGQSLKPASKTRLKQLEASLASTKKKLKRELQLRRKISSYHQSAALLLMREGMYAAATSHLSQALSDDTRNSMLFYYRGYAQAQQIPLLQTSERKTLLQNIDADYRTALKLNPKNTKALYALASLQLLEFGEAKMALKLLERYIDLRQLAERKTKKTSDDRDIKALFMSARAAFETGDISVAKSYYRWIIEVAALAEWRKQAEQQLNQITYLN